MSIAARITNQLAPLTLLGATLAYLQPHAFLFLQDLFLWLFGITMFALGLVLEPTEVNATVREPRRIALGLLTQFTVMPVLGLLAARYSGLPPELGVGFILVGCAPGAMASNVMVYLARGATAYSVALTTVATLLSPVLTPGLMEWLGSVYVPIPFWPMMQTILVIVVFPLLVGMVLRRRLGRRLALAQTWAPAVAVVAIVLICSYAVAANQGRIGGVGVAVFAWVVAINALGYLAGWVLGAIYGFDRRHQLALAIEIGMQNAGLGVALALAHFAPATALPAALFAVWSILTAATATAYLRRRA